MFIITRSLWNVCFRIVFDSFLVVGCIYSLSGLTFGIMIEKQMFYILHYAKFDHEKNIGKKRSNFMHFIHYHYMQQRQRR